MTSNQVIKYGHFEEPGLYIYIYLSQDRPARLALALAAVGRALLSDLSRDSLVPMHLTCTIEDCVVNLCADQIRKILRVFPKAANGQEYMN